MATRSIEAAGRDESGGADRPTITSWRRAYAGRLVITDTIALVWAIVGSAVVTVRPRERVSGTDFGTLGLNYIGVAIALVIVWLIALAAVGSRSYRRIGTGTAEYKAVVQSAFVVLVFISLVSFATQAELSRSLVLVALPSALLTLLLSRVLWRQWLRLHRTHGDFCARVLLVGSTGPAQQIAAELSRHPEAGYHVVGALVTDAPRVSDGRSAGAELNIVETSSDRLLDAVKKTGADTVIVTDGHRLEPARLRELSWSLEPGRQHLVMAPSLTDVAGPRIHARPVAGLPLVHVETPRYEGADRFVKRAFDVVVAGGLLLVASIPLIVVAVLVLTTSPGGLFFSHERIGKDGKPFRMLKFRSMVPGADSQLAGLLEKQGRSNQPLFKLDDDPRITKIGGFIRRYSIDEIPQLLNVVRGDMSLVGPRPQVAREVALYDDAATRRLFVKPGMTGLWQVSGRSNLDWEASVRLDLYYVENWSMAYDLSIMARTIGAVLAKDGAV